MKPTPREFVVTDIGTGRWLKITVGSADAEAWLMQNAPEFGTLQPVAAGAAGEYYLFVSELYDTDTVIKWLQKGYAS